MHVHVETERLLLIADRPEELEAVVGLWTDPEVMRFMSGPRDAEKVREAVQEEMAQPDAHPYRLWNVLAKDDGRFVGNAGILEKDVDGEACVELTYVFAAAEWGKGFATEAGRSLLTHAFEVLGHDEVIALIDPENAPSQRVAERLGMTPKRETQRAHGVRAIYAIRQEPG